MIKNLTEQQAIEIGQRITLLLQTNPIGRDKYKTSLGSKNLEGVGRIIATVMNDIERKSIKESKGA
jgi:hypothetical protein